MNFARSTICHDLVEPCRAGYQVRDRNWREAKNNEFNGTDKTTTLLRHNLRNSACSNPCTQTNVGAEEPPPLKEPADGLDRTRLCTKSVLTGSDT